MNERDNMKKLRDVLNTVPGCQARIMPDTAGRTHRKPYDMFVIFNGRHISLEGKTADSDLEYHQKTALTEDAAAGAKCFVVRFYAGIICFHVWGVTREHNAAYAQFSYADLKTETFNEKIVELFS